MGGDAEEGLGRVQRDRYCSGEIVRTEPRGSSFLGSYKLPCSWRMEEGSLVFNPPCYFRSILP